MEKIVIKRTNEFINRFRNYKIFIDGQQVGTIGNGETKEFLVSIGQHSLIAKIDWCTSQELQINIDENEIKNIQVSSFKYGKWIMPLAGGIIIIDFILKETTSFIFFNFLLFPFLITLFYYSSFGRKKYLLLSESN